MEDSVKTLAEGQRLADERMMRVERALAGLVVKRAEGGSVEGGTAAKGRLSPQEHVRGGDPAVLTKKAENRVEQEAFLGFLFTMYILILLTITIYQTIDNSNCR
jgi:hypothetical protein